MVVAHRRHGASFLKGWRLGVHRRARKWHLRLRVHGHCAAITLEKKPLSLSLSLQLIDNQVMYKSSPINKDLINCQNV